VSDEQISLTVDGKLYVGWVDVSVERSLDRFAHTFKLTYIDRWSDHAEPWPIRTGAACQVKFGEHILVTGYVDVSTFAVDAKGWTLTAAGRSKTGDLVDCSAIHKGGAWQNKIAREIANDLVAPYGLKVEMQTPDNEKIAKFAIMEGESVHDALDRLVKNRGYLACTAADGTVTLMQLLTFVGDVFPLPVDEAIDREYSEDIQDRFSEYRLRSQTAGDDDKGDPITVTRKVDGTMDPEVKRHRPLVIVADAASGDRKQLERRAKWERNVRAGRAIRVSYTMPGVLDERGFTWTPGDHHHVKDDALGIDEELLLVSAAIEVNERQLATKIELTRPQAFSLLEWPDSILNPVTKVGRPKAKRVKPIDQQTGQKARGRR
jgi:prophage tail gpP-like protein